MIQLFAHRRIHPIFSCTIAFILGISSQLYTGHVHIIGLLPILLLTLFVKPTSRLIFFLLLMITYITGGICLQWQRYEHYKLYRYACGNTCDIIAHITDIHPVDHPYFNACITLQTTNIKYHATQCWSAKNFTLQIYVRDDYQLKVDDIIAINNLTFKAPCSTSTFDDYLVKEGVQATVFLYNFHYTFIERPSFSWRREMFDLREKVQVTLKNKMSSKTYMLFASIFLGNKFFSKKKFESIKEHFTTWGITHYLARSGLHMVIFVMGWYFILNLLPIPFLAKEIIIILLSLLYCLLSWASISFVRAFLAFLLYKIGLLLGRQTDVLHILSIVCLIILMLNPMQLFFLDFQLSFGLTCALAYFNQLQQHLKRQSHQTIA